MRLAAPLALALAFTAMTATAADKPKLTLKPTPSMAFAPARIVVTADLTGGAADDPQLYCPAVEWDWGDDTKTGESADCEPFQAGKSEIKRHFTAEHSYDLESESPLGAADYRDFHIQLRLKKSGKVVVSGSTTVKIKPQG